MGTKLDKLLQVSPTIEVGAHTVISTQAGIGGSAKIGQHYQIGSQASFIGPIQIVDQVGVQIQSGVAASSKETGKAVFGYLAIGYINYLKLYMIFKKCQN